MLAFSFPAMVEPEILLDDDMLRRMFAFRGKSFSVVAEDGNKLKRKFRPWPKR